MRMLERDLSARHESASLRQAESEIKLRRKVAVVQLTESDFRTSEV
jgi:hypothetical protein